MFSRIHVVPLVLALAAPAAGQTSAPSYSQMVFNMDPPGARAAAMGGAFIPLADDATAAASNPAGLTVLLYPQVSLQAKNYGLSREASFIEDGDGVEGSAVYPAFASVVVPVGPLAFAAFGHQAARYVSSFQGNSGAADPYYAFDWDFDMSVMRYGGSIAAEVLPFLSIGVSAGLSQLDLQAEDITEYESPSFGQRSRTTTSTGASGSAWFGVAGVIMRVGERISIGASYNRRERFEDLEESEEYCDLAAGTCFDEALPRFDVRMPDSYGAGAAVRLSDALTLVVDAEHFAYSSLAEAASDATRERNLAFDYDPIGADDGWDLRAGAEYILLAGQTPLALRAGAARLTTGTLYSQLQDGAGWFGWPTEAADPAMRYSVGAGTVIAQRFQVDVAGSFQEHRQEFTASLVYMFGRM